MEELKKWLIELHERYTALKRLGGLTQHDQAYWDAYDSVRYKISQIEEASKNLVKPDVSGSAFVIFDKNGVECVTLEENKAKEFIAECNMMSEDRKDHYNYEKADLL